MFPFEVYRSFNFFSFLPGIPRLLGPLARKDALAFISATQNCCRPTAHLANDARPGPAEPASASHSELQSSEAASTGHAPERSPGARNLFIPASVFLRLTASRVAL